MAWRPRVLLVDDDELAAQSLAASLTPRFRVVTVPAAAPALELILRGRFDVVVTEVRLRDGSAMDVVAGVVKTRRMTRVIAMSAHATAKEGFALGKAGVFEYLRRPFLAATLVEALSLACCDMEPRRSPLTPGGGARRGALSRAAQQSIAGRRRPRAPSLVDTHRIPPAPEYWSQ